MSTDRKTDLPDQADSAALSDNLDYQDVKLKIVQQEGYDEHDFNLFDDRASVLWRKPYVDGAVQELTAGNTRSEDELRAAVEQMMLAAGDPTRMSGSPGSGARRLRPTSRSTLRSMKRTTCLAFRHIKHSRTRAMARPTAASWTQHPDPALNDTSAALSFTPARQALTWHSGSI
jgi:hypothetical protein